MDTSSVNNPRLARVQVRTYRDPQIFGYRSVPDTLVSGALVRCIARIFWNDLLTRVRRIIEWFDIFERDLDVV
jgi:hypothetical protein